MRDAVSTRMIIFNRILDYFSCLHFQCSSVYNNMYIVRVALHLLNFVENLCLIHIGIDYSIWPPFLYVLTGCLRIYLQ